MMEEPKIIDTPGENFIEFEMAISQAEESIKYSKSIQNIDSGYLSRTKMISK